MDQTITVTSSGDVDVCGFLYNGTASYATSTPLTQNDDISAENTNFSFSYSVRWGQSYVIGVRGSLDEAQGNTSITITSSAASQTPDYSFIKGRVWGNHEIVKTYNTQSPTSFNHSYYSFGDNLVLPADPIREGYTFLGWFYSDGTKAQNGDFIDFEGEITLIAHWEAIA